MSDLSQGKSRGTGGDHVASGKFVVGIPPFLSIGVDGIDLTRFRRRIERDMHAGPYLIVNRASRLALDATQQHGQGHNVASCPPHGESHQLWYLRPSGAKGETTIICAASDLALDSTFDGRHPVMREPNGTPQQRWQLKPTPDRDCYLIKSLHNGNCVALNEGARRHLDEQWAPWFDSQMDGPDQQWDFLPHRLATSGLPPRRAVSRLPVLQRAAAPGWACGQRDDSDVRRSPAARRAQICQFRSASAHERRGHCARRTADLDRHPELLSHRLSQCLAGRCCLDFLSESRSEIDFPGEPPHETVSVLDVCGLGCGLSVGCVHQVAVSLEFPAQIINRPAVTTHIHVHYLP